MPGHVIEWEGATTRLVQYTTHKKGVNFPMNWRRSAGYRRELGRKINRVILHQSAGNPRDGRDAVDRMASWITRAPKYAEKNGKRRRVGGGRGFPAIPYTFMVPFRPVIEDGKSVVYRLWDDTWHTWHTRRANRDGVGVCFAGSFQTRHSKKFSDAHPTSQALAAGEELILDYLLPRYGLTTDDLCGHFDFGKPMCPGDAIEAWVRRERGETVTWFEDEEDHGPDDRPLVAREQQIAALQSLGYGIDSDLRDRDDWRFAVESFQEDAGLVADGLWGPNTERGLRFALAA